MEGINTTQRAFIKASREAQFLFADDSGIFRKLQQMHEDSLAMISYKVTVAPNLHGDPKSFLTEEAKNQQRLERVRTTPESIEPALSEYLDFHKLFTC